LFEEIVIVKVLSKFFVRVANPSGGGVAPVDVKVPITVEALGPKHAARFKFIVSVM
jgi:hypothetical protein